MKRSRLNLSVLVFFTFSCLFPTATSMFNWLREATVALPTSFTAKWSNRPGQRTCLVFTTTLPTRSPLGTTYYPEWTTHNAPNTWRYQKATRFDKDGTATVRFHDAPSKVGIVTAYNGKFWHTDPQSVDPFPVQRPKSLTTKWSSRPRQKNVLLFETTFPPNNPRDTIYYPQFTYKTIPDKWFHREDNKMITQFDKDGYASVVFNKLKQPLRVRIVTKYGGQFWHSDPMDAPASPVQLPKWFHAYWSPIPGERNRLVYEALLPSGNPPGAVCYPAYSSTDCESGWYEADENKFDKFGSGSLVINWKAPPQAATFVKYENTKWISEPQSLPRPSVQIPRKLVATWSRNQLRLTAKIPPTNSESTLYYLEHKRHLYWVSQRQRLRFNKIGGTLSAALVRMHRPKKVRVRVEFGGTILRSSEQTVVYYLDNISATNNDGTETETKFEDNADTDYFVRGHWKYVHRQTDSPTTVNLYVGLPYSVNTKQKFRIEYRNKLDELQERHTVQANEIGDVYDTFEVGPD
eukprot:903311_1